MNNTDSDYIIYVDLLKEKQRVNLTSLFNSLSFYDEVEELESLGCPYKILGAIIKNRIGEQNERN